VDKNKNNRIIFRVHLENRGFYIWRPNFYPTIDFNPSE